MEQENKDIKATVKQEAFPIDYTRTELKQVNKEKVLKELTKFYRRMIIGQLAAAASITALVIIDKNLNGGDK